MRAASTALMSPSQLTSAFCGHGIDEMRRASSRSVTSASRLLTAPSQLASPKKGKTEPSRHPVQVCRRPRSRGQPPGKAGLAGSSFFPQLSTFPSPLLSRRASDQQDYGGSLNPGLVLPRAKPPNDKSTARFRRTPSAQGERWHALFHHRALRSRINAVGP